jgi:hypothetical protein
MKRLIWLLLALFSGVASAQTTAQMPEPAEKLYFILGGYFVHCPFDTDEGVDCEIPKQEVWGRYVEAKTPLKALTSEGREITVRLTGISKDDSGYGAYPVLVAPKDLHVNEHVFLIWNTDEDITMIAKRPYVPTLEQQQYVSALATVHYMPERWMAKYLGERWFGGGELMDPSQSGNLRIRYFDLGDESAFYAAEVANRVEDRGEKYFERQFSSLIVVDPVAGSHAIVGVERPYYFLRVRDAILVATPTTVVDKEWEDAYLAVVARRWRDDMYLGNYRGYSDNSQFAGKYIVNENGWTGYQHDNHDVVRDDAFSWQFPEDSDDAE